MIIKYDNYMFEIVNSSDISVAGCVREIITNNEYKLNNFKGLKNKILFDIGANCGIATIVMSKLNPESVVYSFEPHKETYDLLCHNVKLNNLHNVKTYNIAVSNKTEERKLAINIDMSGANTLVSNIDNFNKVYHNIDEKMINTIAFDEFIFINKINNIYLLKIDCEGSEYDILYDSKYFKNNLIDNIVGEFHDFKISKTKKNYNGKSLIEYCKQYVCGIVLISVLNLSECY